MSHSFEQCVELLYFKKKLTTVAYYTSVYTPVHTDLKVTDVATLETLCYYMKYASAAYGYEFFDPSYFLTELVGS